MPTARRADTDPNTGQDVTDLQKADRKAKFREVHAIHEDEDAEERSSTATDGARSSAEPTPSMRNRLNRVSRDVELIARAERLLNRVLGYQAAIAVHQLKDELGLDVEELTLSVVPMTSEVVGSYRVVCTIVRASGPEPLVLEVIVEPDKATASAGTNLAR